ncbi:dipeptidase [Kordiimonas marina]|uniref:dipeptidase n=1 Tax=Kordiimonas marina TaxID=2872312 RepID=UPI001FF4375D|nr:membrane dipeptidase [Kordiimonas marina]MCJ9429992.1 dipeptidase [Kordiimonas marina]
MTDQHGNSGLNRRDVLRLGAGAAAALPFMGLTTGAFAADAHFDGLAKAIVINNLGGIDNPNLRTLAQEQNANPTADDTRTSLNARALADAIKSGTTAINQTLGYVAGKMDPYEYTVSEIARWNRIIQHHGDKLLKVWTTADIARAKREGKIGIIMGFQNAAMMGDKPERVDTFAGLGVKIIQLTYNVRNQLGDGSMMAENRGLTDFGREVVERLNAARTAVDLSHSGEQTCLDAIKASKAPICISHTGCRALADLPRNKTDQELKLMADKGGVAGIYFMPFLKEDSFPTAEDVVAHIDHAIKVCGEDHVGIGTDGGTTQVDDMAAYHKIIDDEVERRQKAGISAKGEKKGIVPFIPDLQGPGQFQKLADMLSFCGHSDARIEKVLGGNWTRYYRDIWGA